MFPDESNLGMLRRNKALGAKRDHQPLFFVAACGLRPYQAQQHRDASRSPASTMPRKGQTNDSRRAAVLENVALTSNRGVIA